jgi:hypothetical protein
MAAAVTPFGEDRVARAMLARVFGEVPDGYHLVLFRLDPPRTVSFTDVTDAADNAAGQSNVWVHVGLTRKAFSGGERPDVTRIDALCGLWADLDVQHPVHKKAGLPPNRAAALEIVRAMRLPPGVIVDSGHGIQVWWPFAEPWTFDDAAERRRAQILARAWAITLRDRAKALGYTVDMVSDIARVLRVAGTVNDKRHIVADSAPVGVTVLEQSAATISEDDALSVLLDGSWEQAERDVDMKKGSTKGTYGDIVLDPIAEPPFDKFLALLEAEQKFRQSWDRKRKDMGDSPSEYDMSLANFAVRAGWSDQEVVNLLIAWRRRHGEQLKLDRPDYYALTVGKNRQRWQQEAETAQTIEEIAATPITEDGEVDREKIRAMLSSVLGVEVRRFVQHRSAQPKYRLETDTASIVIGDSAAVLSQTKFRAQVFAIARKVLPKFKDREWEPIIRGLGELCELEDIGEEATERGQARTWIASYLAAHPPLEDRDEAAKKGTAFVRDGATFIFGHELRKWLVVSEFDRVTPHEMGSLLKHFGCAPVRVNVKLRDRWTTKSAWKVPPPDPIEDLGGNRASV